MSYGQQLKKLRLAAEKTVAEAVAEEGVSKRLWEYWEADEKLPPREKDALTRERLLARWKTKARPPGSSNTEIRDARSAFSVSTGWTPNLKTLENKK